MTYQSQGFLVLKLKVLQVKQNSDRDGVSPGPVCILDPEEKPT